MEVVLEHQQHAAQPTPQSPQNTGTESNDLPLIDAAKAGNQEAFRQLYLRHVQASYWLAHSIVRNAADAEDIVQDTFITCYKKLNSIELVGESLLPWLLVTTKYTALNRYRSNQRRREYANTEQLESIPDATELGEDLEYQEALAAIAYEVEHLSELDQRIYHSCIVQEKSYAEAAIEHGVSTGSVRNRLMRIRNKIRAGLNSTHGEEV